MVEWVGERWSLFFLCLYPYNALGVWKTFGIGGCKANEEEQREQMGSVIPKEALSVAIPNGESAGG